VAQGVRWCGPNVRDAAIASFIPLQAESMLLESKTLLFAASPLPSAQSSAVGTPLGP